MQISFKTQKYLFKNISSNFTVAKMCYECDHSATSGNLIVQIFSGRFL